MYPVLYVGFVCIGCVWERMWRLKTHWRSKEISRVAHEKTSSEVKHVLSTWLECEESWQIVTAGFHECFAGKAFPRNILFCHFVISDTLGLYPHYIYPHYPHIESSAFQRENPSHYPWEWEIVISTILYTIHCGFPQLLPLHIQILERLIAQTLTTPILSIKWNFGATGSIGRSHLFGGCNRAELCDSES